MNKRGRGVYARLTGQGMAHGTEAFTLHVAASLIAIALQEARASGQPVTVHLGLAPWELRALFLDLFPGAADMLGDVHGDPGEPAGDEQALRDILWYHAAGTGTFDRMLAKIIARRCQRPNHLWQDLGLGNRSQLGVLMQRYFPALAARNVLDMKWKKFFYRTMCSSTGFALCTAPVCSECDDFDACFGPEDGESLLAAIRNDRPFKAWEAPR
jgi:nitrogen fixation protein NifQ